MPNRLILIHIRQETLINRLELHFTNLAVDLGILSSALVGSTIRILYEPNQIVQLCLVLKTTNTLYICRSIYSKRDIIVLKLPWCEY